MSIRIKKKSKLHQFIQQTQLFDSLIFGFLGADLYNLMLVKKSIYYAIKSRINHYTIYYNQIFTNVYSAITLLNEKTSLKISKTKKGEIKVNIQLFFSVSKLMQQTSYSMSYSYQLNRKNKSKKLAWNSQFYITNSSSRTLWIYKENHSYAEIPSYLMDTIIVRKDDILCIGVPFYNFGKPVSQLTFYPLQANLKVSIECQVQKMHSWSNEHQGKKTLDFEVEDIVKGRPEEFKTKSIKYSPLSNNYRIQLQCIKPFKLTKCLDCTIKCVPSINPTTVVLKKKGCYNDESNKLQLRVGDNLLIYFMKS